MKRKPFQLCGSVVFAMLLLQIIGFTGGKMQEVSVFADDENVITKEYHGFTCKIINEEELIVSGEGKLGSECNVLLSEQNSEETEYEDVILKSITFEEGIEEIDYSCSLYNAEWINLPASCTKIHNNFWVNALNHTVNLSPENTQYIPEDGVVYSRDQSELIRAAKKEYEKFTIPETVEIIQQYAFSGCKIKDLYFSDNGKITEIGYNAFYGNSYSVDYGCEIETVHIPDYIEVISNGNFNNDTNILLEEGSQLISFYCSSKYGQITDVSFLKNAKRLKNFYIGFASLSDESIEVLKGLEELEEIRVESGMLSQEFLDWNRSKYEITLSMGEKLDIYTNDFILSKEAGYNQLPIYGGYIRANDGIETSDYFNENKVAVKGGTLETNAGISIAEEDASVPLKIHLVDWDANMALEEHPAMNANFIFPYCSSADNNIQVILDSNANLWEVTKDAGEFKISKKDKNIEEYIAGGVYMFNTIDPIGNGEYFKYDSTEITLSKSGELRYGTTVVSDNVIKYDRLYVLTQSGELKDMNGKVLLNHIVDFAGCYERRFKTGYVA